MIPAIKAEFKTAQDSASTKATLDDTDTFVLRMEQDLAQQRGQGKLHQSTDRTKRLYAAHFP